MRLYAVLTFALSLALAPLAAAQEVDVLGAQLTEAASAQAGKSVPLAAYNAGAGACALGSAEKTLYANNVMARLYNNGGLFWKGYGSLYEVPAYGGMSPVFASGIWIGGMSGGELRFAGTTYGPFEFWPGPLDEAGNPPAECESYDRIYIVSRSDLDRYDAGQTTTIDIDEWPWQLGAPVEDGDGNPDNYNLAGGDRPQISGHQTAWWVMNDAGGTHGWSGAEPLKMEVQVTAYAVSTPDALDNTTFYRFKLIYRGSQMLTDAWFGMWVDPDLGNAADDYVGSDTTLGLGYVYNAGTWDGSGFDSPSLGYLFMKSPLKEDGGHLGMTTFMTYQSGSVQGPPSNAEEAYGYLQGYWLDGRPITFGGSGYGGNQPTTIMYPGDPVTQAYWSEVNTDGSGAAQSASDRRFLMSTGPFSMDAGDVREIVIAIVWAQGADRLDSIVRLRKDAAFVTDAFERGSIQEYPLPASLPEPDIDSSPDRIAVALTAGESTSRVVRITNTGTADLAWSADTASRITRFVATSNATGPLDPPEMATFAFAGNGFPTIDGAPAHCSDDAMSGSDCNDRPTDRQQVGPGRWGINVGGGTGTFESYMSRAIAFRGNLGRVRAYDFEWRFNGSSLAWRASEGNVAIEVPFELWNTGMGTPDDPSDDFRMIPVICEAGCGGGSEAGIFDIGGDHPVSGGPDDPLSDWISWYNPADTSPGEAGYLAWTGSLDFQLLGDEVLSRQVLVAMDAGAAPPYPQPLPEPGTVLRIETKNQWILPEPLYGTLAPGNSVDLHVDIGVGSLPAGVYQDSLVIRTRVPDKPLFSIPVEFVVSSSTDVEPANGALPRAYSLDQNYPNPFNPSTTIRFGLTAAGTVRLVLYDVIGRQVKVLAEDLRQAGWHTVTFNAGGLPSGAYFYMLEAGEFREVKSLLLVR